MGPEIFSAAWRRTRRTGVYGVVLVAELVGALLLAVLALLFGEAIPGMQSLMWGALAGLAGAFGLLMLYRGLVVGADGHRSADLRGCQP